MTSKSSTWAEPAPRPFPMVSSTAKMDNGPGKRSMMRNTIPKTPYHPHASKHLHRLRRDCSRHSVMDPIHLRRIHNRFCISQSSRVQHRPTRVIQDNRLSRRRRRRSGACLGSKQLCSEMDGQIDGGWIRVIVVEHTLYHCIIM